MIKAVLVDDETFVIEDLMDKLESYFSNEISIMATASSVEEGIDIINVHKPDLVLLDINLKDGTGFDLITKSTYKEFEIIFITGYDNHAIQAIKVGALDYILKPVDDDEFKQAIRKSIENCGRNNHLEKLIEVSGEYFRNVENKRVILKTTDTVYAVYEDDIVYCKSDGNYTTFHTQQSERIVVSKSIKKIEEILSKDLFVRCHQSYIVNKKHVFKYTKDGMLIVHMNIKVPVSSRRKEFTMKSIFK